MLQHRKAGPFKSVRQLLCLFHPADFQAPQQTYHPRRKVVRNLRVTPQLPTNHKAFSASKAQYMS